LPLLKGRGFFLPSVGSLGIVGGMSPKGCFDEEGRKDLTVIRHFKAVPPGSVKLHCDETGFCGDVYEEETQFLDASKKYMGGISTYDPRVCRLAIPVEPKYSPSELPYIVSMNQKVC